MVLDGLLVAPAVLDSIPCSLLLMCGLVMVEVLGMVELVLLLLLSLELMKECERMLVLVLRGVVSLVWECDGKMGPVVVGILCLAVLVLWRVVLVLTLGLLSECEGVLGLDTLEKGVMDILGLGVQPSVDMSAVMASYLVLVGLLGLSGL